MKMLNKLLVIIVLFASLAAYTFASIVVIKKGNENKCKDEFSVIADSIYSTVEGEITKPVYTSLTMANDIFLVDMLKNENSYSEKESVDLSARYLTAIKEATRAQTTFLISDGSKRYYSYEGLNKIIDVENDEHDVWYSIFVNSRKSYDLDVDIDQVNGDLWTVFVNARIEDENGKYLGACGLGLSMEHMQEILKEYESDYNVKVNFIDSEGLVQVDTDTVNIENAYLHDVQYGKEKDGYAYENSDGEYVVMRYVDSLNWYLVVHGEYGKVHINDIIWFIAGAAIVAFVNVTLILAVTRKRK